MKRLVVGTVALGALAIFVLTAVSQPPQDRDDRPDKKGPPPFDKKGPPPWRPGKIMPPHVRDYLNLSDEQENQIDDLEREVRTKLMKIFTEEQKERLQNFRDKGPKGPPPGPDRDGPPEKGKGKGKGKEKDRRPPCGDGPEANAWSPRGALQWCADVASGRDAISRR
jgi:hypothetical protein